MQAHQPSRIGRQRPPGAESHVRAPGRASTIRNMPDVAKAYCAHSRSIPIRDQCQLQVGWVRLARAVRIAPTMSGDFSRSNARGRSDLHSPHDAWTSQTHASPGIRQDRRGMSAASSPFRQNGDSRLAATGRSGIREQIDGLGWRRASLCINTGDPREEASVPPSGWPAGPDIPPGTRRWDSEANAGNSRAPRADGTHAWVCRQVFAGGRSRNLPSGAGGPCPIGNAKLRNVGQAGFRSCVTLAAAQGGSRLPALS